MTESSISRAVPLEARALAEIYPHFGEKHRDNIVVPQMQYRIDLVQSWHVERGERILEIGCGQGDCTLVLAGAVGDQGHVTAIDPASLDYGTFLYTARFCCND